MSKHRLDVTVPAEVKEAITLACRIKRRTVTDWAWDHLQMPYLELCEKADRVRRGKVSRSLPARVTDYDARRILKWRMLLADKTEWDKLDVYVSKPIKDDIKRACKTLRRSVSGWAWGHLQNPFLELCEAADLVVEALGGNGGGSQPDAAGFELTRETSVQITTRAKGTKARR